MKISCVFVFGYLSKGTNQNLVGNSIIPSNSLQLVNMRPPTPTAQVQPKSVATVSPRVVLSNPQLVASRPNNSAVRVFIIISIDFVRCERSEDREYC